MRKLLVLLFALSVMLVCFLPLSESSGETAEASAGIVGKVTTDRKTLELREKPDGKAVILDRIPNGTCILVLEEEAEWCMCRWKTRTGYCATASLTLLRDADLSLLDYQVLEPGDRGKAVLRLKERLMELGYLRPGSTLNNVYNDILSERIAMFQRESGITEDGIASQELQAFLYSDRAPQCTQELPPVRSRVKKEEGGQRRIFCGCCMGEGCECCDFTGWIYY